MRDKLAVGHLRLLIIPQPQAFPWVGSEWVGSEGRGSRLVTKVKNDPAYCTARGGGWLFLQEDPQVGALLGSGVI